MTNDQNSTKPLKMMSAICAIIGVIMLIISFNINPGPPQSANIDQLSVFAHNYYSSILWRAWLQAVGPALIVVFAFAIVRLAGARDQLSGMMTIFGANVLMTLSLMEIAMYIGALFDRPQINGQISLNMIYAIQHLYFIIGAPALFIPLGAVILQSSILPKLFGLTAIFLGTLFATLGVIFLQKLVIPTGVTAIAGLQGLWWICASIALILGQGKNEFELSK